VTDKELPPRPSALSVVPESIPEKLKALPNFVLWNYELVKDNNENITGKWGKIPYQVNGKKASSTDPETWVPFDAVYKVYKLGAYDGVHFALPADRSINGVDFDNCLDPDTKQVIIPEVERWVAQYNSYIEISPGGHGLRGFGIGSKPTDANNKNSAKKGNIELYDTKRFLSITGQHYDGTHLDVNDNSADVAALYSEWWPPSAKSENTVHTAELRSAKTNGAADKILIDYAKRRDPLFKFLFESSDLSGRIWNKNTRNYKIKTYASDSEADRGLINKLAFWTNGNPDQIERIARSSVRARAKWDEKRGSQTWIEREIDNAITETESGFEDADVIRYFKGRQLIGARVAEEILERRHFLTFADNEEIYVYDDREGIYRPGGEIAIRDETQRMLKHKTTNHFINEVEGYIRRSNYVDRAAIEPPLNLIPVQNGILNIDTGEVSDYSPDIPFFVKHPGSYDPALLKEGSDAEQFVKTTFPEDDAATVQEIVGACFYRKYLYKKALMLVGDGDNGKSLLMTLINAALGDAAVSTRTLYELTYNRFALADLYHKNANIQADIGGGEISFTGRIKTLTGGDRISAERKNIPAFQFVNHATLIFSTNDLPEVKNADDVFYARWILVEMPYTFVAHPTGDNERVRDPFLEDKICTDQSVSWFLTWAIDGLQRLLQAGKYAESESALNVKERWVSRTDSLQAFVNANVQESVGNSVTKQEFYEAYQNYCNANNMAPISKELVGRRLPRIVHTRTLDKKPTRSWANIAVNGIEAREIDKIFIEQIDEKQTRIEDYGNG
jgi:putative DNA primase/helicase